MGRLLRLFGFLGIYGLQSQNGCLMSGHQTTNSSTSTLAQNQFRTIQERFGGAIPQRLKAALADEDYLESFLRAWDIYASFVAVLDGWETVESITIRDYVKGIKMMQIIDVEGNVGVALVPSYLGVS